MQNPQELEIQEGLTGGKLGEMIEAVKVEIYGDYILEWRKYEHRKFNSKIWNLTKETMNKNKKKTQ